MPRQTLHLDCETGPSAARNNPRLPQTRQIKQDIAKYQPSQAHLQTFSLTHLTIAFGALLPQPNTSKSILSKVDGSVRWRYRHSRIATKPSGARLRIYPTVNHCKSLVRRNGRCHQRPHGGISSHCYRRPAKTGCEARITETPKRCAKKRGYRGAAATAIRVRAPCSGNRQGNICDDGETPEVGAM
jgi:hypothetical protein